jgi:hypothetical protein
VSKTKQLDVPLSIPKDALWGIRAIADYLELEYHQVQYLIQQGGLPVTKLGPRTIIALRSELDRAMTKQPGGH